jgi:uroporphyrinogen III methyltransferase/synthase
LKVYLVGSGPGDPELLTLKAKRLLETADVVLYDHLASQAALDLAPRAEKHYVGKRRDDHAFPQQEIGDMLIEHWRRGKRVIRLKGGDPFIFGRGGEECEALARAQVPFEVVPGVTAALGAGAYAGIPLTHRDHASHVAFVTGHHPDSMDWSKIAHADTLVVFMGAHYYPQLSERLIAAGRAPDTPAAAVSWGTHAKQKTAVATLATLAEAMAEAQVASPAMIYIGGVANLARELNWFETLPLHGLRIAITRPRAQSAEMCQQLRLLGADVLEYPVIEITPPSSYEALDEAIARLPEYDWLLFTSANGVEAFRDRLAASPYDLRHLRAKLAAIGPATRAALEAMCLKVDLCPPEYVAESLAAAMAGQSLAGKRVLLPQAAVARDTTPKALRDLGATVDVVEAYRTLPPAEHPGEFPAPPNGVDWITFTSSSTVKNFLALAGPAALAGVRIASIGPITSDTLRKHGFEPTIEAHPHTTEGIIDAIAGHPRP